MENEILNDEEQSVHDIILGFDGSIKITDGEIRQRVQVADPDTKKKGAGLRRIINSLHQKGYPICSDTGGYWYAQSQQELLDNAEALRGRAIKILNAVQGMERAANHFNLMQAKLI